MLPGSRMSHTTLICMGIMRPHCVPQIVQNLAYDYRTIDRQNTKYVPYGCSMDTSLGLTPPVLNINYRGQKKWTDLNVSSVRHAPHTAGSLYGARADGVGCGGVGLSWLGWGRR